MSVGKIPPHEAQELEACFRAHARDLFERACVLTRGDQALAHDLVQAAFEAAALTWQELGDLAEEQRRNWLRRTLANIAVNGFRREAAFRDRLPRIEVLYRKIQVDPLEQAFSSITLERCWQVIQGLPERQHAVALLRWGLDMKEGEIAAVLGMAEKTVSVHLYRVRRKLLPQLGADYPFDGDTRKEHRHEGRRPRDGPARTRTCGSPGSTSRSPRCRRPGSGSATTSRRAWNGTGPGSASTPGPWARHEPRATARPRARDGNHGDGRALPPDAFPVSGTVRAEWSADRAVIELYSQHYRALVRLAALLVRDTPTAEEVVQDSFVAMHDGWQRLRDTEKALAYLRQAVVNRSRSVLRHRTVVDKNLQKAPPDMPSAEHGALVLLERSAVVAALRELPDRQREAIVLRYYADLSEAQIATAMGISRGAVKSHTARGMAALRTALEQE